MSEPARRPRRRPGENRERLLSAGIIEFGLRGYHGAHTAAIAERAEVPQPHVYANFKTKQELFLACGERAGEALLSAFASERPYAAVHARFLLQAVSVLGDERLRPSAAALVSSVRSAAGEQGFRALLLDAADRLLAEQR